MSSTPRNPFWPDVTGETGPRTRFALKSAQTAIQQHDDAIVELHNQVTALKTSSTTTQAVVQSAERVVTITRAAISHQPVWDVIHLADRTTYKTQDSDKGCLLLLDNTELMTITLNTHIHAPWFTAIKNLGVTAKLQSESGRINKQDVLVLGTENSVWLFFDGRDWWTLP